jgi:hypothetical protein
MPIEGARTGRVYADTAMGAWVGREAENVPPGWMDNLVKRLLEQVNRQVIRAENAKDEDEDNDPKTRDMNSRSLARLQLTVERLVRLETQRAKSRTTTKADAANANALEELKRRIDLLADAAGTGKNSGASQ